MRKQKTTTIEKAGEIKDSVLRLARRGKENAKRIAATGAAIGAAALVAAGCGTETHTLGEAKEVAVKKYDSSFASSSPAGKYLLQYLRVGYADVIKHRDETGYINDYYQFSFNNGCLGGSAYDTAGGQFRVRAAAEGFLSSASAEAEGEIPSAAANAIVNSNDPDMLIVKSGHTETAPIRFSGVEGNDPLIPVGQHTQDVLKTYGCETGYMGYQIIEGFPEGGNNGALPVVHVD